MKNFDRVETVKTYLINIGNKLRYLTLIMLIEPKNFKQQHMIGWRKLCSSSCIHIRNPIDSLENNTQFSQTRELLVVLDCHTIHMDDILGQFTHEVKKR